MSHKKNLSQGRTPLSVEDYAQLIDLDEPFRFEPSDATLTIDEAVEAALGVLFKELDDKPRENAVLSAVDKRHLLQHLLTIRPAVPFLPPAAHRFIDQILLAELYQKTLVEAGALPTVSEMFPDTNYTAADKTALWQGAISILKIDAIVNAANDRMLGCFQPFHACIDNVIHTTAGPRLREDCHQIIQKQKCFEDTGWAKVTRGYNLPSRFVLHTVGPIVPKGQIQISREQQAQLVSSYQSCLDLAASVANIRSIAFCCISTGVFGFPQEPAAQIALDTVNEWLIDHPQALDLVVFNVFTDMDLQMYREKLS